MISPGSAIIGSYDYGLVALSILIAVLASYAALDLAGRVVSARDFVRVAWLVGGAAAMGTGIWSMHYVGMLALELPVPVAYDWPTVLLSLFAAILASATALLIVSRDKMGIARAAAGSLLMGGGIAGMHYIGMAAMRLPASCHYSAAIVTISVVIAVLVSSVALFLTFRFRGETTPGKGMKILSAVAMGAAISLMHYTGMAAVSFTASAHAHGSLNHALSVSSLGIAGIVAVTFLLLGFTAILSLLDRHLRAKVFRNNELVPLLLESAPEAIYGIDTRGECIFCNQAFLRFTGYTSFQEIEGRNIHDLIHHTKPDGTAFPVAECQIFQAFRSGQETHVTDELLWRKNGTSFPVEYWSHPIHRGGQTIGSVVTFIDITERKRAQKQLQDSENKHRVLFEASADAILVMDETRFIDCNAAALQMFGYSTRAEFLALHPGDFSPPTQPDGTPSRPAADRKIGETMRSGKVRFTWVHRRANGEDFPAEVCLAALTLGGKPAVLGTIRDMTENRRAEDKLRESAARLRLAAESARLGVWEVDLDTDAVTWDDYMCYLHGIASEDFHGLQGDWARTVHPEDLPAARASVAAAIAAKGEFSSEFRVVWPSGEVRNIEARGAVRCGPDGRAQRIIGVNRDVTERKKAHAEMQAAKEKAEAASQAKGEFLANMSHEIRTPLNGILGLTELVLDSDLTRDQRDSLAMVKLSGESLLGVINDILDFSRIESGKLGLEAIPFDLRESLSESLKVLGFRAHQKGLEIVYEVEPDVPEMLIGDPGRIRQIIVNLVGNAIKFTDRGEIYVTVKKEHETPETATLHFAVKDTGIGIPANKRTEIFGAFMQADGSMARKYGGTGLGLAICTRLAELMQGNISVDSELDRGSTFHFVVTLPFQTARPRKPRDIELSLLHNMPVLVVDDNFTNRRVLRGMLSRWGMKPVDVEAGRAALQAIEIARNAERPFPLVILDAQMPEMDGFQMVEQMNRERKSSGATIMMLTSNGQLGDAARCRELGIAAYLMKPIGQAELLRAIHTTLNSASEQNAPLITRHSLKETHNRLRVLVVEDNVVNQTLAVRLLEKRGHAVSVAGDGRQALAALEKEEFDLVLMDVQMPDMNGVEATVAIREKERSTGKHLPIIALTAHALKGDEERYLAAGMDAYVSKPIRTAEMFAVIEKLIGKTGEAVHSVVAKTK